MLLKVVEVARPEWDLNSLKEDTMRDSRSSRASCNGESWDCSIKGLLRSFRVEEVSEAASEKWSSSVMAPCWGRLGVLKLSLMVAMLMVDG